MEPKEIVFRKWMRIVVSLGLFCRDGLQLGLLLIWPGAPPGLPYSSCVTRCVCLRWGGGICRLLSLRLDLTARRRQESDPAAADRTAPRPVWSRRGRGADGRPWRGPRVTGRGLGVAVSGVPWRASSRPLPSPMGMIAGGKSELELRPPPAARERRPAAVQ